VFAAVLGAHDADEEIDAGSLVDQLLLGAAWREWAGEFRGADPDLLGLVVVAREQQSGEVFGGFGVLDADPLDLMYEEAAVLEADL
jgi:hypothetical protein